MVRKLKLVPDAQVLLSMEAGAPARLLKRGDSVHTQWLILRHDGRVLRIYVDYQEVVFKFECFGLMLEESGNATDQMGRGDELMAELNSLQLLFKSEWERPAKPGELPAHYEQVVRKCGPMASIEDQATSACVSLVGMIWSSGQAELTKQAFLINTDDDPMLPVLSQNEEEIASYAANCDAIKLQDLERWEEQTVAWEKE